MSKTDETFDIHLQYSHCNICNIQIYFCHTQMNTIAQIRLKHIKHLEHTLVTYVCSHYNKSNI
jgi:hypothetical protein